MCSCRLRENIAFFFRDTCMQKAYDMVWHDGLWGKEEKGARN